MEYSRYSVKLSGAESAFSKKYPALAHIPFILDSNQKYHRLANRFLIERGLATWHPKSRLARLAWRIPSPASLKNYADWLANFLDWSETRAVSLITCTYAADIKGRYQNEMSIGSWARNGTKLAASTINSRVDQACDFLVWMYDHGLRENPEIPYVEITVARPSSTNTFGRRPMQLVVRQGRLKSKTKAIYMPDDASLSRWLEGVYSKFGHTYGLICESILLTAMRREEILSLDENCLGKDPSKWKVVNPTRPLEDQQIRISIFRGVKGQWEGFTEDGSKIGPPRDILVPLALALAWHKYRREDRMKAFANWMRKAPSGQRQSHAKKAGSLFLDEKNGGKISGPSLYYRWKSVPPPVHGWSIHDGRKWWACAKLWRAVSNTGFLDEKITSPNFSALTNFAHNTIRLEIVPQLGHIDENTVDAYLTWLTDMVSSPLRITHRFELKK